MMRTSDAITINPNQALKRMYIKGQVTLQRKSYWVTRFAEIKDSVFSYRKDKSKSLILPDKLIQTKMVICYR